MQFPFFSDSNDNMVNFHSPILLIWKQYLIALDSASAYSTAIIGR